MKLRCPKCATIVHDDGHATPICPTCGFTKAPAQPEAEAASHRSEARTRTSGLAVASMIMGILFVGLGWVPYLGWIVAPPTFVLAIVFGAVGWARIHRAEGRLRGRGLAIAGIVLASVFPIVAALAYTTYVLWYVV